MHYFVRYHLKVIVSYSLNSYAHRNLVERDDTAQSQRVGVRSTKPFGFTFR